MSSVASWLQNNMMTMLVIWGVVWALASTVQNVFAAGTLGYKIVHVVLALSPADFGKALKVVGSVAVPPVAALALLVGLSASVSACGGAQSPVASPKAQATAQTAVVVASDAWSVAATVCLDAAGVTDAGAANPALAHECETVLQPVHDGIVAAGVASNIWDAAAQNNFACAMASVSQGLNLAVGVLPNMPTAVADAAIAAAAYGNSCVMDGGK